MHLAPPANQARGQEQQALATLWPTIQVASAVDRLVWALPKLGDCNDSFENIKDVFDCNNSFMNIFVHEFTSFCLSFNLNSF